MLTSASSGPKLIANNVQLNKGLFEVSSVLNMLNYAFMVTNFASEDLSREVYQLTLDEKFYQKFCESISEISFNFGFNATQEQVKKALELKGYTSDKLCMFSKHIFQNARLINPDCYASQKNRVLFSRTVLKWSLIAKKHQNNESSDLISLQFKKFIGQLIQDNYIDQAKAIHLMIQFAQRIYMNQPYEKAAKTASMFSSVFLGGLDMVLLNEVVPLTEKTIPQNQTLSVSSKSDSTKLLHENLNTIIIGLNCILKDDFYLNDFSVNLYKDKAFLQDYPESIDDLLIDVLGKDKVLLLKEGKQVEILRDGLADLKITKEKSDKPLKKSTSRSGTLSNVKNYLPGFNNGKSSSSGSSPSTVSPNSSSENIPNIVIGDINQIEESNLKKEKKQSKNVT